MDFASSPGRHRNKVALSQSASSSLPTTPRPPSAQALSFPYAADGPSSLGHLSKSGDFSVSYQVSAHPHRIVLTEVIRRQSCHRRLWLAPVVVAAVARGFIAVADEKLSLLCPPLIMSGLSAKTTLDTCSVEN